MKVNLNDEDISALKECIPIILDYTSNNKRFPDGNRKDPTTPDKTSVSPAFDLSTKRVEFGNGNARVTTVAYEIRCHPAHATLLKSILIQASVLGPIAPSDNHIHFIPYRLLQITDANTVKNQIIQQNSFLANTRIVPILNITPETMQSGLKDRLLAITSVIGLELYSSSSSPFSSSSSSSLSPPTTSHSDSTHHISPSKYTYQEITDQINKITID